MANRHAAWMRSLSSSALLCALGCAADPRAPHGDAQADGGSVGGAETASEFCTRLIGLSVQLGPRCAGGSIQTWTSLLDPTFECAHAQAALQAGRLQFSSDDAQACLQASQAALSSGDCNGRPASTQPATTRCQTALQGIVPIGGACKSFHLVQFWQECVSGAYCKQASLTGCGGTCTAYGKSGDACSDLVQRCDSALSCTAGKCGPRASQAEVCGALDSPVCAQGLVCDEPDLGHAGTCQPRKTTGTCNYNALCASGYMCNASHQCAPVKHQGDSCSVGAGECSPLAFCDAGRCNETLPTVGQACGTIDNENRACRGGYCERSPGSNTGTCAAYKRPGDTCALGSECSGDNANCDDATLKCTACD
jgi:hypothetical protein